MSSSSLSLSAELRHRMKATDNTPIDVAAREQWPFHELTDTGLVSSVTSRPYMSKFRIETWPQQLLLLWFVCTVCFILFRLGCVPLRWEHLQTCEAVLFEAFKPMFEQVGLIFFFSHATLDTRTLYMIPATVFGFATLLHVLPDTDFSSASMSSWPAPTIVYMTLTIVSLIAADIYCLRKSLIGHQRQLVIGVNAFYALFISIGCLVQVQSSKPIHLHHSIHAYFLALIAAITATPLSFYMLGVGIGLLVHHYAAYISLTMFDELRCSIPDSVHDDALA